MSSETKYRRDIQALRGLAVLAVVLFHAKESYFPLGHLGVDVFFVISGFVVTPLILQIFTDRSNGRRPVSNLRYFYKRRFYRLVPALSVTLTISALLIFLLGPIADHQRFSRQGIAALLLIGNWGAYNYSGNYFSPNPNPLVHTWSLSVEEQIYLFLPILLMITLYRRTGLNKVTAVALGLISTISFISFLFPAILYPLYTRVGFDSASQFSFYSPIDRIWQFTLGGLGYLLLSRYQSHKQKIPKSINFVATITVISILFSPIYMSPKVSSICASLIAVTLILLKSLEVLPGIIISKLEWIGDRSYSIYLVHMPLLYFAKYSPVTQIGDGENRILESTIAGFASILLGALSYSKIENKYRNEGKQDFLSLKNFVVALLLALTIPLTLLTGIDVGVRSQYWGIDRSIPKPTYAVELDGECLRDSENGPPCIYANAGASKTVLLLGDSHAGHISQAVVDAAKSANWNAVIWAHSGCPVQFQRSIKGKVPDNCLSINIQMKKWVLGNKPDAIIVSQFVKSEWSQSDLRHALSALHSITPEILLIENTPVFNDNPFSRTILSMIFQKSPSKVVVESKMSHKDKAASNSLATWAKKNSISVMNFNSLFCTNENCTRYAGSEWLYWDDNHLSVAGAALTIPQLTTFLTRL
jgi:peptidoglycan/LPS O-acetylase OafA/YrhL